MVFSHTIGGTSFTEASFQGNAYADEATGFPKALEKIVEHVANAYHGTSTDPLTVGAGAKALTITNASGQIPAFAIGMPVRISRTSDPSGVWMQGEITAWDGATGIATINVDATKGSGSFSDWSIVIGGHLTTASGAPPLAVSQGGTGASTGKAALANLAPGVSGIIETNANFVDAAIFGPALDPIDWSSRTAAATSSLMLATVEDGGADAEVNIWDLTDDNLAGATPLATVAIIGAATPTSIAAAMGYIIVGHEDGITIIDPHDGSWAERTVGWPRSLSTSTVPGLTDNDIQDVATGVSDQPVHDPRTGGPMPSFAAAYGTGADVCALLKDDGNVYNWAGTVATTPLCIITGTGRVGLNRTTSHVIEVAQVPISNITSDDWGAWGTYTAAFAPENAWDEHNNLTVGAGGSLLYQMYLGGLDNSSQAQEVLYCHTNRTYSTGYMAGDIRATWLANSKTADRSYKANDLAETGTVTEAPVEAGAELMAYSNFSLTDYLQDAYDADFDFATGMHFVSWVKVLNNSSEQRIFHRDDPADVVVPYFGCSIHATTGKATFHYYTTASGTGNNVASVGAIDDGEWHQVVGVHDQPNGLIKIYLDGVFQNSTTYAATGSLANSAAVIRVGDHPQAAQTSPMDEGEISLLRFSATIPTDAQIRQMYEAEKGMFAAAAKCLLQSATTDAVLDVAVDPITGKVAVTQTNSAMIFNGLVVESEPTIATVGATWEHNKLYGNDRVEINDANLYATIAAKDLREDLEILRGLKAGQPSGIDLSKAKAWVHQTSNSATPVIGSSFNVKAITHIATGRYYVEFAVPFKSDDGYVNAITGASYAGGFENNGLRTRNHSEVVTEHDDGTNYDSAFHCISFGELESE